MVNNEDIRILAFPKDVNPYQELLYAPLRDKGLTITYLKPPLYSHTLWLLVFIVPQLMYYRYKGYNIVHIHWIYPFALPFINNWFTQLFFSIYAPILMLIIKLLGYKLVWTVHNLTSHEKQFIYDSYVGMLLSKLSDAKIVHSQYTITQMYSLGYDIKNTYIIPFGNFIGYYPNTISRLNARVKFGFNQNETVFLFFGLIRTYKGIEELIQEFSLLCTTNLHVRLLIAGQCRDKKTIKILAEFQNKFPKQVTLFLGYISIGEVQYFFKSADILAIPFKNVTTSSSAILAFSFGKPVVAPLLGNIHDFPQETGIYYNAKNEFEFRKALLASIKNKIKLGVMGKKGYDYIKAFTWEKTAEQTLEVYKKLLK